MPLTKIDFPSVGASDWTDFIDIVKDWIVGHINVGLTNYNNASATQVALGSKLEIGGSYYYAATAQTPTGSLSADTIYYLYVNTAGAVSWSSTVPIWSNAKHGFYNGNDRCIGGCYVDSGGSNQYRKWIYHNWEYGPKDVWLNISAGGVDRVDAAGDGSYPRYGGWQFSNDNTSGYRAVVCEHGDLIDELYCYFGYIAGAGTMTCSMRRQLWQSSTSDVMYSVARAGSSGGVTDSTIASSAYRLVDLGQHYYYLSYTINSTSTSFSVYNTRIKARRIIRPPVRGSAA